MTVADGTGIGTAEPSGGGDGGGRLVPQATTTAPGDGFASRLHYHHVVATLSLGGETVGEIVMVHYDNPVIRIVVGVRSGEDLYALEHGPANPGAFVLGRFKGRNTHESYAGIPMTHPDDAARQLVRFFMRLRKQEETDASKVARWDAVPDIAPGPCG